VSDRSWPQLNIAGRVDPILPGYRKITVRLESTAFERGWGSGRTRGARNSTAAGPNWIGDASGSKADGIAGGTLRGRRRAGPEGTGASDRPARAGAAGR